LYYGKFLARDGIIRAGRYYAIALPFVCLSVSRVYHRKMVEVRIMEYSPYGGHIPLVFAGMRGRPKFHLEILRCPLPKRGRQNLGREKSAVFTARCTVVQSVVLRFHVVCLSVRPSLRLFVCLSVTLVNCDHIGWNSSEIISPLVSLGCSLSDNPNIRGLLQGEHPEILA